MSDRIDTAAPSWRAARDGAGSDASLRRMAIAACCVGGVLLLGLIGASLFRHGPRAVPVIEAEAGPVRIKPVDPGGMTAMGAQIGTDLAAGGDKLAPAPEAPKLDAFRRELRPHKLAPSSATPSSLPPASPTPPSAPAALQPASTPASTPGRPPGIVASPAARQTLATAIPAHPEPGRAEPAASTREATPARPAQGHAAIQLAAFDNEPAARAEWDRLRGKLPALLGSRAPIIERAEHDGHPIWRLRTGGFADMAEAATFCERLRAQRAACSIAF